MLSCLSNVPPPARSCSTGAEDTTDVLVGVAPPTIISEYTADQGVSLFSAIHGIPSQSTYLLCYQLWTVQSLLRYTPPSHHHHVHPRYYEGSLPTQSTATSSLFISPLKGASEVVETTTNLSIVESDFGLCKKGSKGNLTMPSMGMMTHSILLIPHHHYCRYHHLVSYPPFW